MPKALFLTTHTNEVGNHIRGWESVFGEATRFIFNIGSIRNDWRWTEGAAKLKPDVIFYIGACGIGGGAPHKSCLRALRKMAPMVHLCSDAADPPWHPVLRYFREEELFDLQVALDGALDAPVDFATLTPIDPRAFSQYSLQTSRTIRCGFSGTKGGVGDRFDLMTTLEQAGLLKVRHRLKGDGYDDHVQFITSCQMLLNMSGTGSRATDHIKGRVVEAGWARCALLEPLTSPIHEWFPKDCYFSYKDVGEAATLIRDLTNEQIEERVVNLAEYTRANYHPRQIYGSILERIGLHVGPTK